MLLDAGLDSMEKLLAVADANDTGRLVSIKQIGERSAELYIASLTEAAMVLRPTGPPLYLSMIVNKMRRSISSSPSGSILSMPRP